ncbi:MAG: hypothetical protein RR336_02510 [Oscillospiraceae bacterium]
MSKLESETVYPLIVADIRSGTVFPAIRDNAADFYYKGYRLYRYNGEFSTDEEFKAGSYNKVKGKIDEKQKKDFERAREERFRRTLKKRFELALKEDCELALKEDCERTLKEDIERTLKEDFERTLKKDFERALKKDFERAAIAQLYKYSCPLSNSYILLDIEAGLPQMVEEGSDFISNTQIDLVFLSKKTKKLVFVEVKRQKDSRVSQRADGTIEVDAQMKKYKALIEVNRDALRVQYKNQIEFLARITGDDYSGFVPEEVVSAPYLLVYGYDETIETSENKSLQPRKKGMEALAQIYGNHLIKVKTLAEFDPGVQILEFQ